MIFFSGWGLLVPIFGILGAAVALELIVWTGGDLPKSVVSTYLAIGGLVAAGACWWIGSLLSRPRQDKRFGTVVMRRRSHSFMFIPMRYYAFIYLLIFGFVAAVGAFSK